MVLINKICQVFILLAVFSNFICFGETIPERPPNRHALVIAVGDYPEETGWRKINSVNDVPLITSALQYHGFENIHILKNQQATKEGILQAMERELINKVAVGDMVVIHFSGHGQQIYDDNGDELDGFDEALVPYDAHMKYQAGVYEGQNHIRDDQVGSILQQLQGRLGEDGNIMLVVDACYSGTISRGTDFAESRGTDERLMPTNYIAKLNPENGGGMDGLSRGEANGLAPNGLAPLVVFSGARQNQKNYETYDDFNNPVGSLSLALSKNLMQTPTSTTYRELFDMVKADMAVTSPMQSPQLEGNGLDQYIFSKQQSEFENYFMPERYVNKLEIELPAGTLAGLHPGSKVAFYSMKGNSNEPTAIGEVQRSSTLKSTIALDRGMSKRAALKSKVKVTDYAMRGLTVHVKVEITDPAIDQTVEALLQQNESIKLVNNFPDLVISDLSFEEASARGDEIKIYNHMGMAIERLDLLDTPQEYAREIQNKISRYGVATYVSRLQDIEPDETFGVNLEIVPIDYDIRGGSAVFTAERDAGQYSDSAGNIRFPEGQAFAFRVNNFGNKDAYFNILEVDPQGKISLLLPAQEITHTELFVEGGTSKFFNQPQYLFGFSGPIGSHVIKVIASDKPFDLRPVVSSVNSGGRSGRSDNDAMQSYFSDLIEGKGSRSGRLNGNLENLGIHTVVVEVN